MPNAFEALFAEIVPVLRASSALFSDSSFHVFVGPSFFGVSVFARTLVSQKQLGMALITLIVMRLTHQFLSDVRAAIKSSMEFHKLPMPLLSSYCVSSMPRVPLPYRSVSKFSVPNSLPCHHSAVSLRLTLQCYYFQALCTVIVRPYVHHSDPYAFWHRHLCHLNCEFLWKGGRKEIGKETRVRIDSFTDLCSCRHHIGNFRCYDNAMNIFIIIRLPINFHSSNRY